MYWPKFATFVKHKKDLLEDYVDCLSTWIASSLMLFFCSIASIGFYNGSHMECIIPAEYPDEWRSFFKTYCFVQPHIFVHDSPDDQLLRSEIAYFPWVPFFFFLHACAFYLPKLFWQGFSLACGFDMEGILIQAKDVYENPIEVRQEKIKELASNLMDNLSYSCGGASSPRRILFSLTPLLFLLKKWLIVTFSVLQFSFICEYIANGNYYWGFEVLWDNSVKTMLTVNDSPLFPIHSWCPVPIFQDNEMEEKTALCVLGMNVIYEKLYIVTYFLLLLIIPISILSAGYYTLFMFCAFFRCTAVDRLIGFRNLLLPTKRIKKFTNVILGANGVLTIILIKNNFGESLVEDLLKEVRVHNDNVLQPSAKNDKLYDYDDYCSITPPPKFSEDESLIENEIPLQYTTVPGI